MLDIGAYVGIMSLHFAAMGATVHAFEGSPRNISRLNLSCKNHDITTHEIALSNVTKTTKTRFNDCIDREHPMQEVTYEKYDDYAKRVGIPSPSFVKMDIEGMESLALLEMKSVFENRAVFQVEYHGGLPFCYNGYPGFVPVEEGGFDFNSLRSIDYVILDEELRRTVQMESLKNYFFVPKERLGRVSIKLL